MLISSPVCIKGHEICVIYSVAYLGILYMSHLRWQVIRLNLVQREVGRSDIIVEMCKEHLIPLL